MTDPVADLRQEIASLEKMDEDCPGLIAEVRRNKTVDACLEVVAELISEGSTGLEEENYLLSLVVLKLMDRVHLVNQATLLRYDLLNRQ
jgi:hypothetical protein